MWAILAEHRRDGYHAHATSGSNTATTDHFQSTLTEVPAEAFVDVAAGGAELELVAVPVDRAAPSDFVIT